MNVTTQEQLEQCLQVRREVFVKEQEVPESLEVDELDVWPLPCEHFLLVDDNGKPVGAARMREYKPGTAKFQRIAVLQSQRGKGAGLLMLQAMEQRAKHLGYSKAVLDAQCQAEGFYEKSGFHTVSKETFLDAGIPHVRMEKLI